MHPHRHGVVRTPCHHMRRMTQGNRPARRDLECHPTAGIDLTPTKRLLPTHRIYEHWVESRAPLLLPSYTVQSGCPSIFGHPLPGQDSTLLLLQVHSRILHHRTFRTRRRSIVNLCSPKSRQMRRRFFGAHLVAPRPRLLTSPSDMEDCRRIVRSL